MTPTSLGYRTIILLCGIVEFERLRNKIFLHVLLHTRIQYTVTRTGHRHQCVREIIALYVYLSIIILLH